MNFEIIATAFFQNQVKDLDKKSRRIIGDKIRLIKLNPFRYKRVHSKSFSRVHRVWLTIEKRATRLVYAVVGDKVFVTCLLDRDKDYKDLEGFLKSLLGRGGL